MRLLPFPHHLRIAGAILAGALTAGCAAQHSPAANVPAATTPGPDAAKSSLVAQGAARFKANKCDECHGAHGEGTDDAPDLTGSRLNAEEIAHFLERPSAHARSVGMPQIPSDSPDLQPLVAFVVSLERPR